jgi:hypothetical protein
MTKEPAEERERVQGKVAAVLNERELAINVGSSGGVQLGMKFKILADVAEVRDPDTGEILGVVRREKVRVEAVRVLERMSICRTYRTVGLDMNALLAFGKFGIGGTRHPETLKAEDSEYLPPLSEEQSYVKRGDPVEELRGREIE